MSSARLTYGPLAPTITIEETLSIDTSRLDWKQKIARVKFDLESSKNCLLSIDLKFWSFIVHKGNPNEFEPFISNFRNALIDIAKEIAQHAHRIQHFQLVVDEGATTLCIVAPFFARPMHRLLTWNVQKRLESGWASISNNWNFDEPSAHSALIQRSGLDFSLYPNLLSVVFRAVPVEWALFMPKNLVSLDISLLSTVFGPSLHDLHRILNANAHSLKHLTLSAALYGETGFYENIFLSQLKTLNLGFIHTNELLTFLQVLHVPNLEEFGLCDSRFESAHDQWGCYTWDAGIGHLLVALMSILPLNQVTKLHLRYISFYASLSQPCAAETVLLFLSEFVALMHFTLLRPDALILNILNHETREQGIGIDPQSLLKRLQVLEIEGAYFAPLAQFLHMRLQRPNSFPRLAGLTVKMPVCWYQQFGNLGMMNHLAESLSLETIELSDTVSQQLSINAL
ncbi:hypothetical protein H0H92_008987 [Tricholoma furcatifolium]|nr:hypothetical protein H0H92_008987 [Tricholoma furcatifolium]